MQELEDNNEQKTVKQNVSFQSKVLQDLQNAGKFPTDYPEGELYSKDKWEKPFKLYIESLTVVVDAEIGLLKKRLKRLNEEREPSYQLIEQASTEELHLEIIRELQRAQKHREGLDNAQTRFGTNRFGICFITDAPIPIVRLVVQPMATRKAEHKHGHISQSDVCVSC